MSHVNNSKYVATPLLEECEDDIHTPEMGTRECVKIILWMRQKELLNLCTNKTQRNATIANLKNLTLISSHLHKKHNCPMLYSLNRYIWNIIVLCSTPSIDIGSNRPYVYDIVEDTLQQYFEGNH